MLARDKKLDTVKSLEKNTLNSPKNEKRAIKYLLIGSPGNYNQKLYNENYDITYGERHF